MLRDFLWTKMHTKSYNVTPGQKFKFCENKFLVKVYKSCKKLYSLEKLVRRKKKPQGFPAEFEKSCNTESPQRKISFTGFSSPTPKTREQTEPE